MLAHLLAHHERVVAKEELLDEVWGDRFVSESTLTTRIKEIRRAIGDDGTQQRLVRNVRGRGYRFIGELAGDEGPRRTPIIGRSVDVTAVVELLGSSRLVTLVGPGGVGKTRLAVEVVSKLAGHAGDGSAFVDLAAIVDPDAIVPALLHAVGIRSDAGDAAAALRTVGELDALVVLDNCEHLIDAVASVVDTVVAAPGRVHFLATSRERLARPASGCGRSRRSTVRRPAGCSSIGRGRQLPARCRRTSIWRRSTGSSTPSIDSRWRSRWRRLG